MTGERVTRRQKDISRLQRERIGRVRDTRMVRKPPDRGKGVRVPSPFSRRQVREIEAHGLSVAEAARQLTLLRRGVPFVHLVRPCRIGDGIRVISPPDFNRLVLRHEEAAAAGRMIKFIPASGAASRMFEEWFRFLLGERTDCPHAGEWGKFPFYPYLREILAKQGLEGDLHGISPDVTQRILQLILADEGLGYGNVPKALIPFHRYGDEIRTPLEEHLVEAAGYVRDRNGICRLHVTTSVGHREKFLIYLADVLPKYEKRFDVTYDISFSDQDPGTDTIALDARGHLVVDNHGKLLFRPGGHGALLKNLNELQGDIIFIKNIDNVTREERLEENVLWHKIMGGLLVEIEWEIRQSLVELARGQTDRAEEYVRSVLGITIPGDRMGSEEEGKRHFFYDRLHRPLRVCGMVKNEGEPGGAPFWVRDSQGQVSLQIVEEIQVDHQSGEQMSIWREATHFNPVDLVCAVRDEMGKNYDLTQFADPQTAIVTHKTDRGRPITALEHPGLWNGGMAWWNTIFVEIPGTLFNPVKTYADLLRPCHQHG